MTAVSFRKFKIGIEGESPQVQGLVNGDIVIRQYEDSGNIIYSLLYVLDSGVDSGTGNKWFTGILLDGEPPQTGEVLDFSRVTSMTNENRSGAVYVTSIDDGAPYIDVIDKVAEDGAISYPVRFGAFDNAVYNKSELSVARGDNADVRQTYSANYNTAQGWYRTFMIARLVGDTSGDFIEIRVPLSELSKYEDQNVIIAFNCRKVYNYSSITSIPFKIANLDGTRPLLEDELPATTTAIQRYFNIFNVSDIADDVYLQIPITYLDASIATDQFWISDLTIIPVNKLINWGSGVKSRLGRLTGINDETFGALQDYGLYTQRLYATKDVNIAGTLTAGDENGFGSTFYAGKISKNLGINSIAYPFDSGSAEIVDEESPTGIGRVWRLIANSFLLNWQFRPNGFIKNGHVGKNLTFSFYARKTGEIGTICRAQYNGTILSTFEPTEEWQRFSFTFNTAPFDVDSNILRIYENGGNKTLLISGLQIEFGDHATQYQPTDDVVTDEAGYGAWFNQGGIGGTIQNPLLRLGSDGGIYSKDNSFWIDPSGNANFAGSISASAGFIGCWTVDSDSIYKGTKRNVAGVFTTEAGSVTMGSNGIRGFGYRLEDDGSGALANGKISWDERGDARFEGYITAIAGDSDGQQSIFYVGKMVRNLGINSGFANIPDAYNMGRENSPTGVGYTWTITGGGGFATWTAQSAAWAQSNAGRTVTISVYMRRTNPADTGVKVRIQDGTTILNRFDVDTEWRRYSHTYTLPAQTTSKLYRFVEDDLVSRGSVEFGSMQLEYGDEATVYQMTDETLDVSDKGYGVWMTRGGIGGTIQNPLLKFENDGSIVGKNNNFVIYANGEAYFKGNITASSGQIANWIIATDAIYSGTLVNTSNSFTASGSITIGSNGIRGYGWRFETDGSGALARGNIYWDTAGNFYIQNLNATSGQIGGWNITSNALYIGTFQPNDAFAAANSMTLHSSGGIRARYFRVDTNGYMYAQQGVIADWTIASNVIYRGTARNSGGTYTLNEYDITIGTNGIRGYGWRFEWNGTGGLAFGNVTWNTAGRMTMNDIYAATGQISSWLFTTSSIYRGTEANVYGSFTSASQHMTIGTYGIRGYGWRIEYNGTGALAFGNVYWTTGGVFVMQNIQAISGTIGGWSLAAAHIYCGTLQPGSSFTSSGITLSANGTIKTPYWRIGTNGKMYAREGQMGGLVCGTGNGYWMRFGVVNSDGAQTSYGFEVTQNGTITGNGYYIESTGITSFKGVFLGNQLLPSTVAANSLWLNYSLPNGRPSINYMDANSKKWFAVGTATAPVLVDTCSYYSTNQFDIGQTRIYGGTIDFVRGSTREAVIGCSRFYLNPSVFTQTAAVNTTNSNVYIDANKFLRVI